MGVVGVVDDQSVAMIVVDVVGDRSVTTSVVGVVGDRSVTMIVVGVVGDQLHHGCCWLLVVGCWCWLILVDLVDLGGSLDFFLWYSTTNCQFDAIQMYFVY